MAEGSDILCTNCGDGTSEVPNEIVICDVCNRGYHQRCHKPKIPNSILEPNVPWSCRLCVFALGTKEGSVNKLKAKLGEKLNQATTCLPYELSLLNWDEKHQTNCQNTYCYCGGPGEFFSKMLQCKTCCQWFHEACIQCLETPLLYGDHYYIYICSICNKGRENVKRIIMKWSDVVALVLHNLSLQHGKRFFDLAIEIVPFIQNHCHMIKLSEDLNKLRKEELTEKVYSILTNNQSKFMTGKEAKRKSNTWGLRPTPGPLIFAPPNATTISSTPLSAAPIIYGACRKRASIVPSKPKNNNKQNLSKIPKAIMPLEKVQMGRSNSVTSLNSNRSGTSSLSEATTSSSKSSIQPVKPTKVKSKSAPSKLAVKAVKRIRSKSNNDNASYSHKSLEAIIPLPENFEGKNNPFYDIEVEPPTPFKKSKIRTSDRSINLKSEIPIETETEGYRIVTKPDSPSKLTIQRVSLSPKSKAETEKQQQQQQHQSQVSVDSFKKNLKDDFELTAPVVSPPKSEEKTRKFNVLARRVTTEGKVEYLLETLGGQINS